MASFFEKSWNPTRSFGKGPKVEPTVLNAGSDATNLQIGIGFNDTMEKPIVCWFSNQPNGSDTIAIVDMNIDTANLPTGYIRATAGPYFLINYTGTTFLIEQTAHSTDGGYLAIRSGGKVLVTTHKLGTATDVAFPDPFISRYTH